MSLRYAYRHITCGCRMKTVMPLNIAANSRIVRIKMVFICLSVCIQHAVAVTRAILPTVREMVTCLFIRTEYDTRVSKASSCSVDRTEYVRLTGSGPGRFLPADVSTASSFL